MIWNISFNTFTWREGLIIVSISLMIIFLICFLKFRKKEYFGELFMLFAFCSVLTCAADARYQYLMHIYNQAEEYEENKMYLDAYETWNELCKEQDPSWKDCEKRKYAALQMYLEENTIWQE